MKVVSKGAGRPAAAAKRTRNAQTTPLPPRKGRVADAQEAVRVAKAAPGTRGAKKAAKPAESKLGLGTSKVHPKAEVFATRMRALGWKTSRKAIGSVSEVTATRGPETIWISWTGGALTNRPMPSYSCRGRTITLRNASEALRFAMRTAPEAEAREIHATRRAAVRKAPLRTAKPVLSFDPGTALDEEVVTALLGNRVEWTNRLTDSPEVAWVPNVSHEIKIEADKHGDRQITFRCPATGYRTFRLSALRKVGGSAPRKAVRGKAKK